MTTTTDSVLREKAEKCLTEAQDILGWQIDGLLYEVSGDGFWSGVAARGEKALERAKKAPRVMAGKAAQKIKEAAQAGLDKASDAADEIRAKLAKLAGAAGLLLASPFILIAAMFIILEGSGKAGQWRGAAQRHYRTQYARGKRWVASGGRSF